MLSNLAAAASLIWCSVFLLSGTPDGAVCEEAGDNAFTCASPFAFGVATLLALSVPALAGLASYRFGKTGAVVWPLAVVANAAFWAFSIFMMTPHA